VDTLTHGLAGALCGRALPSTGDEGLDLKLRRREAWTGLVAAMFPDGDALLSPFSADFYITHHRGLTHSFLMMPLWAVLLAVVAAFLPRPPEDVPRGLLLKRLAAAAGLGVLSHILLDWITSWGTMFFAPVSWARFSLDWVFIIDFILSGLLILGLILTRVASRSADARGRLAARASLAAACAYVAFCALRHSDAMALQSRVLPGSASERAAVPQPLSPDRWLLLADDGANISMAFVDVGRSGPDGGPPLSNEALEGIDFSRKGLAKTIALLPRLYRSPDDPVRRVVPKSDGPLAARTLTNGSAGLFGRFARFPLAREEHETGGGTMVLLRDARFGHLSSRVDPFTYIVRYDAAGLRVFEGFPSSRWAQERAATHLGTGR
jgi:inner membrane protein